MKARAMMQRQLAVVGISSVLLVLFAAQASAVELVTFDELLSAPETYWHGPDPNGEEVEGEYGPEIVGSFSSGGVKFANIHDTVYSSWRGFAYSNITDNTTPGHGNQFSAVSGSGMSDGNDAYAVAFGYWDLTPNLAQPEAFDPTNAEHLISLPTLKLPVGTAIQGAWVTNTTYAALSMQTGDGFSKKFGGESGSDPDWLKVTAYGTDSAGTPMAESVEFYLADFRFANSMEDYIVEAWSEWDLSPLAGARQVHFNLSSSDVGTFGLNTPPYFALDNLELIPTNLTGDYNQDGFVNLADYTLWRDTLGSVVSELGAGADGNRDGMIDAEDYGVWRSQFGTGTPVNVGAGHAVPEPSSLFWLLASALIAALWGVRK
jgi:hypothetical protein